MAASEYRRRYYQAHKERASEQGRQWYQNNRERKLETCRKWRTLNTERCRKSRAKRLYGLSPEEYDRILHDDQRGLCRLCSVELSKPVVEHDHITNTVRGFVCQRCNILIGSYESARNLGLLETLQAYVEKR